MKPFLLLATRGVDLVADEEYDAMLRFSGLDERDLHRVRLEQGPLGHVDLDEWAGVILGGGPFTVSDAVKSPVQERVEAEIDDLLTRIVERDHPFLGACYGVGTLGRRIGAVVDGTYAEPVGPMRITLTDEGAEDPLFGLLPPAFDALLGHKEAITSLPPGAVVLASSATCPVQGFRVGRNVYATQFHPELDVVGIATRINVYRNAGYFPPEDADALIARSQAVVIEHPPRLLRRFVELYAEGDAAAADRPPVPARP